MLEATAEPAAAGGGSPVLVLDLAATDLAVLGRSFLRWQSQRGQSSLYLDGVCDDALDDAALRPL
eukprot:9448324-Alexandrium_andersonii.AAC.1